MIFIHRLPWPDFKGTLTVDWTKPIVGILAALVVAAIIAIWKLVGGKVDKLALTEIFKGRDEALAKAIEAVDREIKAVNERIDKALVVIAQGVTKTDLIDRMSTATTRSDDRDSRVQRDVVELKSDLKALSEKIMLVDKKLDELPTRVASLEQTRNQSQK